MPTVSGFWFYLNETALPEAYKGEISTAWDIWSLGVIIIQALTGELPFKGDTPFQLLNQITKEEPDLSQLPPGMKELVEACLQKDRKNRPTAQQVLDLSQNRIRPTAQQVLDLSQNRKKPLNLVSSETRVDYTPLNNLLAAGEWKQADKLTYNLMLKATKREKEGWLDTDNYKNFPREDLKIMDDLWGKYSNGKFGFSVQKKIWIEVGGTPGEYDWDVLIRFCDRIGWRKCGLWLSYSDLTFNINAPEAHLPLVVGGGFLALVGLYFGGFLSRFGLHGSGFSFLFSRL